MGFGEKSDRRIGFWAAAAIVPTLASSIFGSVGLVLSAPIALLLLMSVPGVRVPAFGGLIGWGLWFLDYDCFLNVGGPETPLSNRIRGLLGVPFATEGWGLLAPMTVLVALGAAVGFFADWCTASAAPPPAAFHRGVTI